MPAVWLAVAAALTFSPRTCCPCFVSIPTAGRTIAPLPTLPCGFPSDLAYASAAQLAAAQEPRELAILAMGPPLCANLLGRLCCGVFLPTWARVALGISGLWFLIFGVFEDELIRKPVETLRVLEVKLNDLRVALASAIVGGALRAAHAPHAKSVVVSLQVKYGEQWLELQSQQELSLRRRLVA